AGGAGDDTYIFANNYGADTVIENAAEGNDTIDFSAATGGLTVNIDTAALSTSGAGGSLTHNGANIENIITGSGSDTFVFADGAALTGTLTAGLGSDTLDHTAYTTALNLTLTGVDATGFSGTEANSLPAGFSGIDIALGGTTAGDTLNALPGAGSWTLNASPTLSTYTFGSDTLGFDFYENLSGGSSNIFTIFNGMVGNNLIGGSGDDLFIFTVNGSLQDGFIDGQGGNDTLSWVNYGGDVTVDLQNMTGTGLLGTTTFTNIDTIVGSANNDTIIGPNANTTWDLTGADAGTVNGIDYSGFENISGGNADDIFDFADGATVSGTIDGGAGVDTLDFADYTTARDVTLTAVGTIDGFQGTEVAVGAFDNVDNLIGTPLVDSLTGMDAEAFWNFATNMTYSVTGSANTLTSTSFETLTGNSQADNFIFADGATFNGTLNGAGGVDLLNYSAFSAGNPVTVNLMNGSASNIQGGLAGTLSNIENIFGGAGDDTLTGDNNANLIDGNGGNDTITANGGTDVIIGNAGDDVLNGGDGDDTYIFDDGWGIDTTPISDSSGTDTLDFTAVAGEGLSFVFNTLLSTVQTLSATASVGFILAEIENFLGGQNSDSFIFTNAAAVNGSIDGQAGTDTLDFDLIGSPVNLTLTGLGTIDGYTGTEANIAGGFDNIDAAIGSGLAGDTLNGLNVDSTWTLNGAASSYTEGSRSFGFDAFETVNGGSA
ncbi:MAG: hypothetical protein D6712_21755, partial [Chloroflexi bacterium]